MTAPRIPRGQLPRWSAADLDAFTTADSMRAGVEEAQLQAQQDNLNLGALLWAQPFTEAPRGRS